MFTEITLDTWKGRSLYTHFSVLDIPYYSVTSSVDVTAIHDRATRTQCSFFSLCLYGITHALNEVEAFRYRVLADGRVVRHEQVETVYIILHPDETITTVHAPLLRDFDEFCRVQKDREHAQRAAEPCFYHGVDRGVVFLSCLPWFDFTAFSHPCNLGARYDSIPRLTIGKYTHHADGHTTMPFDLQMHHGFVDGLQVGTVLQAAQRIWSELA